MTPADSITLIIWGEPRGKARPRFSRSSGRAYTDAKTASAEGQVQHAWDQAGRPRLEGPLAMKVEAVLSRPLGHYRKDGTLNPAGTRSHWPTKAPDLDNVWKLASDSLNRLAFHDDSQIVTGTHWKRWASANEQPHLRIEIWPAPVPSMERLRAA